MCQVSFTHSNFFPLSLHPHPLPLLPTFSPLSPTPTSSHFLSTLTHSHFFPLSLHPHPLPLLLTFSPPSLDPFRSFFLFTLTRIPLTLSLSPYSCLGYSLLSKKGRVGTTSLEGREGSNYFGGRGKQLVGREGSNELEGREVILLGRAGSNITWKGGK
jgi:hypothetical protein